MDVHKIAHKIASIPTHFKVAVTDEDEYVNKVRKEVFDDKYVTTKLRMPESISDLEIELNNLWWAQKSCQEIFKKHNNESNPSEHEIDMKDFWKEWSDRLMKCVNRINSLNPNK